MSVIRCPKCKLINMENVRRCRRCSTALSLDKNGDVVGSKSLNFNQTARHLAIPVIVIVSLLCIYGYYGHSKDASSSGAGLAETNKVIVKSAPANRELEEVKKLNQDFLAKLDQNMSDRQGEGFHKNQTLAYDTTMMLQEKQSKLTDAAALKHFGEFYRLVSKYYDQLVRFNSETAHLAEVRQRTISEIEHVHQDPSIPSEYKDSREADLGLNVINKFQERNVIANDINETVKSLRNLLAPGAAS
jgi:hypothetical protein